MRTLILASLAVLLAACGNYRWVKDGAGNADFQRDSEDCRTQSQPGQWESCMTQHGWRYTTRWY